jgi:hypothetical protein
MDRLNQKFANAGGGHGGGGGMGGHGGGHGGGGHHGGGRWGGRGGYAGYPIFWGYPNYWDYPYYGNYPYYNNDILVVEDGLIKRKKKKKAVVVDSSSADGEQSIPRPIAPPKPSGSENKVSNFLFHSNDPQGISRGIYQFGLTVGVVAGAGAGYFIAKKQGWNVALGGLVGAGVLFGGIALLNKK